MQVDTSWQQFLISDIGVDPELEVKLSFMLGQSKASNIWIDSIVLIEEADSQSAFLNPVLPVESGEQPGNIHVYPNPASDHFFIESSLLKEGDFVLNVIRQDGSIVLTRLLSGQTTVRVFAQGWTKGLYFLSLKDNLTGAYFNKRLIVR